MIRGKIEKIETLKEGAAKISIAIPQEELYNAVALSGKEVRISEDTGSGTEEREKEIEESILILQGLREAFNEVQRKLDRIKANEQK